MNYFLVSLELSCNNKEECPSVMGILFIFSLELSCNKTVVVKKEKLKVNELHKKANFNLMELAFLCVLLA